MAQETTVIHAKRSGKYLTTGKCRLSFPSLFEQATFKGEEVGYRAHLMIPKTDKQSVAVIVGVINELRGDTTMTNIGLTDGDKKARQKDIYAAYAGHYILSATNRYDLPAVLHNDEDYTSITDPNEVYAGCYVQAILKPRVWKSGLGIQFLLDTIVKLEDGEPFATGTKPLSAQEKRDLLCSPAKLVTEEKKAAPKTKTKGKAKPDTKPLDPLMEDTAEEVFIDLPEDDLPF